jgi:hypothetical protein
MTTTHDDLIATMAARRPDAVLPAHAEQALTLTPFAALLHRTAALITREDLPPALLSFGTSSVVVTALPEDHLAQGTVRRWAAAVELVVDERPCDMHDGTAGVMWTATGYDGTGVYWNIAGRRPVDALASA